MRCYIVGEGKDIGRRIRRKIITQGVEICNRSRIRKLLPITGSYTVRAQGGGTFRESDIKGDGWRPVICLNDGQNDRENTGLDIPYGDSRRDGNVINPFTVGRGRGVSMVGP